MFGIGVPAPPPNWKTNFCGVCFGFSVGGFQRGNLGSVDLGAATPVRTAGEFIFAPTRKTVLLVFVQSERESLCHEAGQQTPLGIFHLCFSLIVWFKTPVSARLFEMSLLRYGSPTSQSQSLPSHGDSRDLFARVPVVLKNTTLLQNGCWQTTIDPVPFLTPLNVWIHGSATVSERANEERPRQVPGMEHWVSAEAVSFEMFFLHP